MTTPPPGEPPEDGSLTDSPSDGHVPPPPARSPHEGVPGAPPPQGQPPGAPPEPWYGPPPVPPVPQVGPPPGPDLGPETPHGAGVPYAPGTPYGPGVQTGAMPYGGVVGGPGYGPPPGPPPGPAPWAGPPGGMPPSRPVRKRPGYVVTGSIVLVGIVVAALVAFLPGDGWSQMTKNSFMSSCTKGASERASPCRCVLDILQDKISEKTFLAEEARLRQGGELSEPVEAVFTAAVDKCT